MIDRVILGKFQTDEHYAAQHDRLRRMLTEYAMLEREAKACAREYREPLKIRSDAITAIARQIEEENTQHRLPFDREEDQ